MPAKRVHDCLMFIQQGTATCKERHVLMSLLVCEVDYKSTTNCTVGEPNPRSDLWSDESCIDMGIENNRNLEMRRYPGKRRGETR